MTKKMGRPTNNPKPERIDVRLDNECIKILEQYSRQENITRTEAVRQGIKKLNIIK